MRHADHESNQISEAMRLSRICADAYEKLKAQSPSLAESHELGKLLQMGSLAVHEYHSEEATALTIALAGEFSTGKSTLINALLEEELLPSGDRPLTSINVQIQHADIAYIKVTWNQNLSLTQRRLFLAKYVFWLRAWRSLRLISPPGELICKSLHVSAIRRFLAHLETERKTAPVLAADRIEIGIPIPEPWRHVRFLDIPGSGAIRSIQEQIQASYKHPYIILYTIDARRIGSKLTKELLQQYAQRNLHRLVVINKWDTVPPRERQDKWDEAEELYGVKAVPFGGLPCLMARLLATKRIKVKKLVQENTLNLAKPMNSPEWHRDNVEANSPYLADFLLNASNYTQFADTLQQVIREHDAWQTNQYKKQLRTILDAYEKTLTTLEKDIEHQTAKEAELEHEQEKLRILYSRMVTICNTSAEVYRDDFERAFQESIESAERRLRERARGFAEGELHKNARNQWNVISWDEYIGHPSWNDTDIARDICSKLYKVTERSINDLNNQLEQWGASLPKIDYSPDTRPLSSALKEIISSQKSRLFHSLQSIASDRNGYPSGVELFLNFLTHAMDNYIHRKRARFYADIDSITHGAFDSLKNIPYVESYRESLSPIQQWIEQERRAEEERRVQLATLRRERDAAEHELNIWRCADLADNMKQLHHSLNNTL